MILEPVTETVITGVKEEPLDLKALQALPGIAGYIVQEGDSLWDIAKKFAPEEMDLREYIQILQEEIKDSSISKGMPVGSGEHLMLPMIEYRQRGKCYGRKRLTVKVKNIKNYGSGDEVTFDRPIKIKNRRFDRWYLIDRHRDNVSIGDALVFNVTNEGIYLKKVVNA